MKVNENPIEAEITTVLAEAFLANDSGHAKINNKCYHENNTPLYWANEEGDYPSGGYLDLIVNKTTIDSVICTETKRKLYFVHLYLPKH